MIWLDLKKLERRILNNKLTEKQGFEYVMAYFILQTISMSLITHTESGGIRLMSCIVNVLITVWGLKTVYEINKSMDDKDFFKRFFAISWVIGIRILLAIIISSLVLGIFVGIYMAAKGKIGESDQSLKDVLLAIGVGLISILNYQLMINSFQRLKAKSTEKVL